jgi:hypothetical protein
VHSIIECTDSIRTPSYYEVKSPIFAKPFKE